MGYSPWGRKQSDTTEATYHGHIVDLPHWFNFRCTAW